MLSSGTTGKIIRFQSCLILPQEEEWIIKFPSGEENLDYCLLMKLTLELTKDFGEIEKLFRLMCFNVFAHNRDDHSCNFSYL